MRLLLPTSLALLLSLCACGARTELAADEHDASADAGPPDAAEERGCTEECLVGHDCCAGSCGGPTVETATCCTCAPGEVDSRSCAAGHCGR